MSMNPIFFALFGDIGGPELLVVFAAILLLFGGKRLPSIARQLGRMVEDLRKTSQDFKNQLMHADEELNEITSGKEPPPDAPNKPERPAPEDPRLLTPGQTPGSEPARSSVAQKEPSTRDLPG